jgi:hypothetical protein
MVGRTSAADRRCARIARAAAWLLATAALAAPAPALAADRDGARSLWDAYPLHPAGADAPAPPPGTAGVNDASNAAPVGGSGIVVLLAGAVILAGSTAQLIAMRRTRLRPAAVATAGVPDPAPRRAAAPRLWARAAGAPAGAAPPAPDRAWAAEIEWHQIDGRSEFRIAARPVDGGTGPVTLGASEPLEWPPRGARSVQALTDAVRVLESSLVATGWSALPPGGSWYAKRFSWQPRPTGEHDGGQAA